jgi:serine/threonine protein kinase
MSKDLAVAEAAVSGCVDESTLVRFFAGDLSLDRLLVVEGHLDSCAECARLVDAAAPLLAGVSGTGRLFGVPAGAEPGQLIAGRYRIDGLIGQGASGHVLRARDELAGVMVAVKLLRSEAAAQSALMQLFTRELRVARALNHPHVCRVFDLQVSGEDRFLVMELGQGSLRDELRSGAAVERPLAERLADAGAIAAGLTAIHDAGIVHRDVKPENLLRLPDGRLVLSDFGLATLAPMGSATRYVGTPLYMAPEVAAGEPATRASDIYSLGIVLHELFFGRRPEWHGVGGRRVRKDPPRLRGARERAIARLARDCLQELPDRRPGDARAVAHRLAAIRDGRRLSNLGVSACNRRSLLAAASLLLITGGTAFSLRRRRSRGGSAGSGPPTPSRELLVERAWRASFSNDGLMVVNRSPGPGFELVDRKRNTRQVLSESGTDAVISPDGNLVAFVTEPYPGLMTRQVLWVLARPDGVGPVEKIRRVTPMGEGGYPSWSPDSRTLYFHNLETRTVMALGTEGGKQQPRVFFERARTPSLYPAVSPDGKGIAFGAPERLVVLDRGDGSEWLQWPTPGRRGLLVSWSPDGGMLAFSGFRDDPLGVWVLGLQQSRVVRLSSEPSGQPGWTSDGEILTYDSKVATPASSIWQVSSDTIRRELPRGMGPDAFHRFVSRLKLEG